MSALITTNTTLYIEDFFTASGIDAPITIAIRFKRSATWTSPSDYQVTIGAVGENANAASPGFTLYTTRYATDNNVIRYRFDDGTTATSNNYTEDRLDSVYNEAWCAGGFTESAARTSAGRDVFFSDGGAITEGSFNLSDSTFNEPVPHPRHLRIQVNANANVRIADICIWARSINLTDFENYLSGTLGTNVYAFYPLNTDWGTGDVQDASGNNRHITPPAGWTYDSDHPRVVVAAPALTSPTATDITATGATKGFTTDAGNGTAWVVVTSSATKPTAGQIKAGQDHTGAPALHADSKSVTAIGAQSFPAWSGGQPLTEYHFHIVHNGDTSV